MSKEKIEEMEKCSAIKEMELVIRNKTVSCQTCTWYMNGVCDDSCELAEDNQKICTDLYNAGYRNQSEWISVDERLPDWEDGKVLVFTAYGFSVCERTVNGRWQGKHANWITHWMPLPEAPKMKGGAE